MLKTQATTRGDPLRLRAPRYNVASGLAGHGARAPGPDLLLEFAAGLEHQDAAHTVVRDEHLVLVVNSHGNRLNQIVV